MINPFRPKPKEIPQEGLVYDSSTNTLYSFSIWLKLKKRRQNLTDKKQQIINNEAVVLQLKIFYLYMKCRRYRGAFTFDTIDRSLDETTYRDGRT